MATYCIVLVLSPGGRAVLVIRDRPAGLNGLPSDYDYEHAHEHEHEHDTSPQF